MCGFIALNAKSAKTGTFYQPTAQTILWTTLFISIRSARNNFMKEPLPKTEKRIQFVVRSSEGDIVFSSERTLGEVKRSVFHWLASDKHNKRKIDYQIIERTTETTVSERVVEWGPRKGKDITSFISAHGMSPLSKKDRPEGALTFGRIQLNARWPYLQKSPQQRKNQWYERGKGN
jgi:hypothetical protein